MSVDEPYSHSATEEARRSLLISPAISEREQPIVTEEKGFEC